MHPRPRQTHRISGYARVVNTQMEKEKKKVAKWIWRRTTHGKRARRCLQTGYLTRFSSSAPIHRGQSSMCFRSHRIPAPKPFHIFPYCSVPTVPTTATLKTPIHPSIQPAMSVAFVSSWMEVHKIFHFTYCIRCRWMTEKMKRLPIK